MNRTGPILAGGVAVVAIGLAALATAGIAVVALVGGAAVGVGTYAALSLGEKVADSVVRHLFAPDEQWQVLTDKATSAALLEDKGVGNG